LTVKRYVWGGVITHTAAYASKRISKISKYQKNFSRNVHNNQPSMHLSQSSQTIK